MNKSICAVIVSFNSPAKLKNCIHSSLHQVDKIIVIDNTADSNIKNIIGNLTSSEKVSFIFNEANKGLGFALNQGIKYSLAHHYSWTLLLDQDSILSENMVYEMISSFENLENQLKEETALIVPVIYDRNFKREIPAIITTNLFNKKITDHRSDVFVHFQITSGSLIRNEAIKNIGLMNEYFFIDFIDFDYCFRVLSKNYKILQSRNALLYHALGERRRKLFFHLREHYDPLRIYYQVRNRLLTVVKYGKKQRSFLYSEGCRVIAKLLKILLFESGKKAKIKMYFKGIRDFIKESMAGF